MRVVVIHPQIPSFATKDQTSAKKKEAKKRENSAVNVEDMLISRRNELCALFLSWAVAGGKDSVSDGRGRDHRYEQSGFVVCSLGFFAFS